MSLPVAGQQQNRRKKFYQTLTVQKSQWTLSSKQELKRRTEKNLKRERGKQNSTDGTERKGGEIKRINKK